MLVAESDQNQSLLPQPVFSNLILLIHIFQQLWQPRNTSVADTDASIIDTFSTISSFSHGCYSKRSYSFYCFQSCVNTVRFLIPSALPLSIYPHSMDAKSAHVSKLKNVSYEQLPSVPACISLSLCSYTEIIKVSQKKTVSFELSSSPIRNHALPTCIPRSPFHS